MKKGSPYFVSFLMIFTFLLILPFLVQAQSQPPGPGDTDIDAPIDGGLSLLVAAGIGYGVKKNRDNRKKKTAKLI